MKIRCLLLLSLGLLLTSCASRRTLTAEEKARIEAEVDAIWDMKYPRKGPETKAQTEEKAKRSNLMLEVKNWIGVPYALGGNSHKGVDCSGLACQIYQNVYGKQLHRRSDDQYRYDIARYLNGNELKPGDLVFFSIGRNKNVVNHVGIYLDDYKFVHAGNHGVRIEDLRDNYFQRYWTAGGRVK